MGRPTLGRRERTVGAGHAGDAERARGLLGDDLVAHQADVLGAGTDEGDAVLLVAFGAGFVWAASVIRW